MELTTQLRELREKSQAASDGMLELVEVSEKEDRDLTEGEQEQYDAHEKEVGTLHTRMKRLEKRLKVNEYSEDINDDIGLNDKEKQNFSLRKLIRAMAFPGERRVQEEAQFEMECSAAVAEKRKTEPKGYFVPQEVWSKRATQVTSDPALGGNAVAERLAAEEYIEMLRNRSLLVAAGARQLPNLIGDLAIPKKTGTTQAYWLTTETTDVTESDISIGLIQLSPKNLGVHSSVSRQALMQTTPAMDSLLEDDMRSEIALAVDHAGFYGTGAAGQPTGIANTVGIGSPAAFAAALAEYPELMAMVAEAAIDNALVTLGGDSGALGQQTVKWAMNGADAANYMAKERFAGTGKTIVDEAGNIGPWGSLASQQITLGDTFFGDFAQFLIATWGGIDLIVDPYSQSQKGVVRMTVFQSLDYAVRHPQAFVMNNDS